MLLHQCILHIFHSNKHVSIESKHFEKLENRPMKKVTQPNVQCLVLVVPVLNQTGY